MNHTKNCKCCGKYFQTYRADILYCSDECRRTMKQRSSKNYRDKNPEKIKEDQKKYNSTDEVRAAKKKYRDSNRDKINEYKRMKRAEAAEKRDKVFRKKLMAFMEKNPETISPSGLKYNIGIGFPRAKQVLIDLEKQGIIEKLNKKYYRLIKAMDKKVEVTEYDVSIAVGDLWDLDKEVAGNLIAPTNNHSKFLDNFSWKVEIDYPLDEPITIDVYGDTIGDVLWGIAQKYKEIFSNPEKYQPWRGMPLFFERMYIRTDNSIKLGMGS